MKRIAWLTDLHLSAVEEENRQGFIDSVSRVAADALMIGGDIGEAQNVATFLRNLEQIFAVPIYFVLGNHDFYGGSIRSVRKELSLLSTTCSGLHYLTSTQQPISLSIDTGLIGHDGWADGRAGDYEGSHVMLNDYQLIEELAPHSPQERLIELHRLGDEAALHIGTQLELALQQFCHVFLLTHVPPFRDACWYQGHVGNDEWAPHFVCQAMGKRILEVAQQFPEKRITVLCGHTHSPGTCDPAENVHVITGGAKYGDPDVTQLFELS